MPSSVVLCLRTIRRNLRLLRFSQLCQQDCIANRSISSEVHGKDDFRDPATYFFNSGIQKRLRGMTRDYGKVFERRKEGQRLKAPVYKFLTNEALKRVMEDANQRARYFLQMPPVLLPRPEINVVLSKDPEIKGFDESSFVFTDISTGIPDSERMIVVRERDGVLRKAKWEEREQLCQAYFPVEGRTMHVPEMFSDENLQSLLERSELEYVLDRACLQFEPDDPKYIHVTSTVYDYIDAHSLYYNLYGTRHFGSVAFYLIFKGRIEKFLVTALSGNNVSHAVTIIDVYYMMNPELRTSEPADEEDINFIKDFIDKHAVDKRKLSSTLRAYEELKLPKQSDNII